MSIRDKLSALKVAIYIRVSTHWQVDKDSLKVQERELIAYCQMVLGINDYVVFTDPGYSAKNTDRPDYQAMMDRIRTGEFSHLLVWKIDRISRNIIDFATMSEELKHLGVAFVSKNEQFDTSTAMGEAMLQIIMVFAQFERKQTSERVTAVMLSRAGNGQWNGGRVPYGYLWDKETASFQLCETEAGYVRRMAQLYEEHQSLLHIVKWLNDAGVKTRRGFAWTPTSVHVILTNPWYIGQYVYNVHSDGKGVERRDESEWVCVEHHHEPILSEDQFYRIKFLLTRNRRGTPTPGKSYARKHTHIFSGLMRCGICGSNMSASADRRRANGFRPSQYACASRRRKGTTCTNKYISDLTVGSFVLNYAANIIRAARNSAAGVQPDILERKLLRGETFKDVESINSEAIQQLLSSFAEAGDAVEYRPQYAFTSASGEGRDMDNLRARKRKLETALSRLNALFLYDDEAMPEKDFIVERTNIERQLAEADKRIAELAATGLSSSEDSSDFLKKASYFIMVNKLIEDASVDYEKLVRTLDPTAIRDFVLNIVQEVEATDGRITAITFRNGTAHRFKYKT